MPTNLKSLLSRSRSRNELKGREKDDASSEVGQIEAKDSGSGSVCLSTASSTEGDLDQFQAYCDISTLKNPSPPRVPGQHNTSRSCLYNNPSYSSQYGANYGSGNDMTFHSSVCSDPDGCHSHELRPMKMRKCETVVTLSSITGATSMPLSMSPNYTINTSIAPTAEMPPTTQANEKVKLMKNKILSTSSSTLNCLLHSSSRSKLFSSWKLSSIGSSSGSEYPDLSPSNLNSFNGSSSDAHPQFCKSQLSIPFGESNVVTSLPLPLTPLNRLRRNISINNTFYSSSGANLSYSRSSSVASFAWKDHNDFSPEILCPLCLCNVTREDTIEISACSCRYCKECITAYINFEIQEGAEAIACPDASCANQGNLSLSEMESLVLPAMIEKHRQFRMYREVEKDGQLMWCPTPGCETVCRIEETIIDSPADRKSHKSRRVSFPSIKYLTINCVTCRNSFCAECKLSSHPGRSCECFRKQLIKEGKLSVDEEEPFSLECIKKCPFCHVPIEKDSGCAQMMCKKCKHVFCWYCLSSLDDDFLLRHYDKGPCKNKLGHSRASVIWHRAQVIGIFVGFGALVLLAAPLLILAAPCLLCCRCRYCSKDPAELIN